jgi:hypothetical protein
LRHISDDSVNCLLQWASHLSRKFMVHLLQYSFAMSRWKATYLTLPNEQNLAQQGLPLRCQNIQNMRQFANSLLLTDIVVWCEGKCTYCRTPDVSKQVALAPQPNPSRLIQRSPINPFRQRYWIPRHNNTPTTEQQYLLIMEITPQKSVTPHRVIIPTFWRGLSAVFLSLAPLPFVVSIRQVSRFVTRFSTNRNG